MEQTNRFMNIANNQDSLENYFQAFRENIIGYDQTFTGPAGKQRILYADWIASGRLYLPIEQKLTHLMGPFVGNTHTETTITGTAMTLAYHKAQQIIKQHVNASEDDVLITSGFGMTGAVNRLQRILGLRIHEKIQPYANVPESSKPVVFVTHMEHHSNHTSWIETIADVVCVEPNEHGLVNLEHFEELLQQYKDRPYKIAAVTACSNVTGISTPYYKIAQMIHRHGGLCFVDFACSAPYVSINMHPEDEEARLDAIYFSPHKFLGGPGTPGIVIFNKSLYTNKIPDRPGGGTVSWTNPWGGHRYFDNIEEREDGGTPGFLQTIKAALAIQLKEKMGVQNIIAREEEMVNRLFDGLEKIDGLHIMADNVKHRLGIISFYVTNMHYNLGVKLLNDRFGVQVRGGCSCAGTYGHYLLHISPAISQSITDMIDQGDLSKKPGWIRVSIHPTMTDEEVDYILFAIKEVVENHVEWGKEYVYDNQSNEFVHLKFGKQEQQMVQQWFDMPVVTSDKPTYQPNSLKQ